MRINIQRITENEIDNAIRDLQDRGWDLIKKAPFFKSKCSFNVRQSNTASGYTKNYRDEIDAASGWRAALRKDGKD